MKARKLKQILNNTGYTVAFYDDYIGIGSPLCHDLLRLDIEHGKIKYALDTWRKGRESVLHHEELTFIWDKLHELVENGGMVDIINGNDVIENPLPVYTVRNGALLCTVTDAYGWPNVTIEGYMMHDNDYFKTAAEALEYGIKEYEARASHLAERLKELQNESSRIELLILESKDIVAGLKLLTPSEGGRLNTMTTDPKEQPEEVKAPATETEQEQVPGEATQEETEG